MEFPHKLACQVHGLPNAPEWTVTLYGGFTALVGPNGSGKTQLLRALQRPLSDLAGGRKVRLLSAGRLWHLEQYRTADGGREPGYDHITFGGTSQRENRHSTGTVVGEFHTLDVRPDLRVKVAARLAGLFRREVILEWERGDLKVSFAKTGPNDRPYSAGREASGLLHLVSLLTSIYDNEVGALLIDEPEVSLHPQLQSFLLHEISAVAGNPDHPDKKLVVIATHSTAMIDVKEPEDLANLLFCSVPEVAPIQVDPNAPELQNRKLRDLLPRLGQEHKAALFSLTPVLVEGPSDMIICGGLDRLFGLHLSVAGAQLIPMAGKGAMPTTAKFMKLIGKKPVVLADADAVADGLDLAGIYANEPAVTSEASKLAHESLGAMARSVLTGFSEVVSSQWAEIASVAEAHAYWQPGEPAEEEHDAEKRERQRQRRAALATLMTMSEEDLAALPSGQRWVQIRNQLIALLDFLEDRGCFVLRRGTIEDYYSATSRSVALRKPSAAVKEAAGFTDEGREQVKERYADVLRALSFAANVPPIDEIGRLRESLVGLAAVVVNRLSPSVTVAELTAAARQQFGDRAGIFQIALERGDGGVPEALIHLDSPVLAVDGFPVRLRHGCNPVDEVNRQLRARGDA